MSDITGQRHWGHPVAFALILEISYKLNPVDLICFRLAIVPLIAELPIQIGNNTAGDSNAHPKYIDENEKFVLHQTPKGDEQVILDHGLGLKN